MGHLVMIGGSSPRDDRTPRLPAHRSGTPSASQTTRPDRSEV